LLHLNALHIFLPLFFLLCPPPPRSTLFPYTTLFRSIDVVRSLSAHRRRRDGGSSEAGTTTQRATGLLSEDEVKAIEGTYPNGIRSEEHTSELQSQSNLVCRLLLEKKKKELHKTKLNL